MANASIKEFAHFQFTSTTATVATAGTRVQISTDATIRSPYVVVQASSANAGTIYLGGSTVSSTNGLELFPGESFIFNAETSREGNRVFRLSDIYLDSTANGLICRVMYALEATS